MAPSSKISALLQNERRQVLFELIQKLIKKLRKKLPPNIIPNSFRLTNLPMPRKRSNHLVTEPNLKTSPETLDKTSFTTRQKWRK